MQSIAKNKIKEMFLLMNEMHDWKIQSFHEFSLKKREQNKANYLRQFSLDLD